jgi:hypothetical protein
MRDKIAASRLKGKWTGGTVPLGYEAKDKTLVVNRMEAEAVRAIFRRYLELQSFSRLVADLARGPKSAITGSGQLTQSPDRPGRAASAEFRCPKLWRS